MKKHILISSLVLLVLGGCKKNTAEIKNLRKGSLEAIYKLKEVKTKKILLDSSTAPSPQYIQIFKDSLKIRNFTFLNTYNNSIYFYNYETLKFIKKITYDRKGPDGILKPTGYFIKDMDSIYMFDLQLNEIVLTNNKSRVLKKYSLRGEGNSKTWYKRYPQYNTQTVQPFIETTNELLLVGQFMSVPDNLISKNKFIAHLNKVTGSVTYSHTYPKSHYGYNYNWEGGYTIEVFPVIHSEEDKLIFSFPVSHDLFISDLNFNNYTKVYAGSNFANTIHSIDKDREKTSRIDFSLNIMRHDNYAAILYDKYRHVYYRFLRKAIPNATFKTSWKKKPIAVIMLDEKFNYLGETTIGNMGEWRWQNSFVTKEGLNIEYLDDDDIDEVALTLKIFNPVKL